MLELTRFVLMLLLGDGSAGEADEVGCGGMSLRGGALSKESADGGGLVGAKTSLFPMVLTFRMSEVQRFSSMAWSAHDFSDPTLPASPGSNN